MNNIALQKEVAETRAQIESMRADKDSDRAQLADMEAMLKDVEAIKSGAQSTVEIDRTPMTREDAPQGTQNGATGKVSGDGADGLRGVLGRAFWARILKPFTEGKK